MQKLIKINTDHYIIVDESKQPVEGYYYDSFINKIKNTNGAEYGEAKHCWQITYSTQPLELLTLSENGLSGMGFSKVKPLNIFNVKELIGEVDVVFERYPIIENDKEHNDRNYYRRSAYNQALEDNKEKKYTEEDLKYMFECGRNYQNNAEITFRVSMEYLQQSKTEWDVEFIDGKLKLK